jgi:hypothetical protein
MHKGLAKNPITTHAMDEDGPNACKDSDAALALFKKYKVGMVFVSHSHMYAAYDQDGIEVRLTGGLGAGAVIRGVPQNVIGTAAILLGDYGRLATTVKCHAACVLCLSHARYRCLPRALSRPHRAPLSLLRPTRIPNHPLDIPGGGCSIFPSMRIASRHFQLHHYRRIGSNGRFLRRD